MISRQKPRAQRRAHKIAEKNRVSRDCDAVRTREPGRGNEQCCSRWQARRNGHAKALSEEVQESAGSALTAIQVEMDKELQSCEEDAQDHEQKLGQFMN